MALTNSYLTSTKNLDSIMNSVISARAPERFTNKFLEDLGFKSSNDRLIIAIFKALGLLDDSGQPTQRYYQFLDQTQSKQIIAIGIQEAYEDLFNLRKDAQNMSNEEVKNKLRTLTQGQKSDRVIDQMALTFRALCNYADWSSPIDSNPYQVERMPSEQKDNDDSISNVSANLTKFDSRPLIEQSNESGNMNLHYNIQIHLPETTNMAVYDAIFQSLKKHLF